MTAAAPFARPRLALGWHTPLDPVPAFAARWLFLRALGLVFLSAFAALAFQIEGLIGPHGIQPAQALLDYLAAGAADRGETGLAYVERFWNAPTLLWLGAGDTALKVLVATGLAASLLLVVNVLPRLSVAVAFLSFLSFVTVGGEFANYQSDGMLLEAGLLSVFLAPSGLRPGLGVRSPPARAPVLLLLWEWFRIHFESGVVKLASGDPQWRGLTALDHYYENGPLPTWVGWYVAKLPHGVHVATAASVLGVELLLVWLIFFGRRARRVLFLICTSMQVGIIATANYAFLNYLVLSLGVFLLDDSLFARQLGGAFPPATPPAGGTFHGVDGLHGVDRRKSGGFKSGGVWGGTPHGMRRKIHEVMETRPRIASATRQWHRYLAASSALLFAYATVAVVLVPRDVAVLGWPVRLLGPARVANRYGLFAVMTRQRDEVEFQGTLDGVTWVPYPFRYKPQNVQKAPAIYAPYQPRFDWNLWFASLGTWRENEWVVDVEERLASGSPEVLSLFARDPFGGRAPQAVRTVRYRYAFSDWATRRATGAYWVRSFLGPYAPAVGRQPDGTIGLLRDEPGTQSGNGSGIGEE